MNSSLILIMAWTCPAFDPPELVGQINNLEVNEASGLVALASSHGFWTHNDSGDRARLFAFDSNGESLGDVEFNDLEAIDWEDLSAGPCGDARCLVIGDIGDNASSRVNVTLHRFEEPEPPGFGNTISLNVESLKVVYPNGAIDAEGLAVDPQSGDVLIVTKNRQQPISTVYHLDARQWGSESPVVLTRVGDISWLGDGLATQATAAAIDPTGNELFVHTYTQGQRIKLLRQNGRIESLGRVQTFIPWSLGQCEAMAFTQQGQTLWFTCESAPAPLAKATCASEPPASTEPTTRIEPSGCGGCQQAPSGIWAALLLFALRLRSKGVEPYRRSA